MLHISLVAETLWTVWGFHISNAFVSTLVVMVIITVLSYMATRKLSMVPGNAQLIAETIVGGMYDFFKAIAGRHIDQFFPIVAALFLFILTANWVGLLPGVGTVGLYRSEVNVEKTADQNAFQEAAVSESEATTEKTKFVPLLRGATADLNTTLALAVVSVLAMQYFGFLNLGTQYISRFLNFKDPILFSVGLLELISDISKVISFAFRLFGNIFAGEVLLAVIAFLMPFIVPLPFLLMELFVGIIQALVFSMLSTAFFTMAVSHGEEHA